MQFGIRPERLQLKVHVGHFCSSDMRLLFGSTGKTTGGIANLDSGATKLCRLEL